MDDTVLLAEDQKKLRDVVRDYFAAHGVVCGLGLAVVRNIVALHGGSCAAQSAADGICFRVELP